MRKFKKDDLVLWTSKKSGKKELFKVTSSNKRDSLSGIPIYDEGRNQYGVAAYLRKNCIPVPVAKIKTARQLVGRKIVSLSAETLGNTYDVAHENIYSDKMLIFSDVNIFLNIPEDIYIIPK